MYLCMYTNIICLCMIKARIRWCSCRVEKILTLGKLLRLWFCFLLHSILFFISQTSYRTYKIISSYDLARPIMGTIFLVVGERAKRGRHSQVCSIENRGYIYYIYKTYYTGQRGICNS